MAITAAIIVTAVTVAVTEDQKKKAKRRTGKAEKSAAAKLEGQTERARVLQRGAMGRKSSLSKSSSLSGKASGATLLGG